MLTNLLIKNYALIQHLEIHPEAELNIITGETGAGKSIMLGAVGLLTGNRADSKVLFDEDEKCVIEGTFDISQYDLKPVFEEEELDYEPVCLIRREISPTGKSRAFINDTPVTLEVLKRIGNFLMDIHSQHDTLLLGSNTYQLQVIDLYAQNKGLLQQYQDSYRNYRKLKKAYDQLVTESSEIKKEADFNNYLLEELQAAKLQEGEQESMESELEVLENAEEIKTKLNQVVTCLGESDHAILQQLHISNHTLSQLSRYSEHYQKLQERTESCLIELKDIYEEVAKAESIVEFDPQKTDAVKERLSMIYQLQKKHNVASIGDLLSIQTNLEAKATKSMNLDEEIAEAKTAAQEAEKTMLSHAKALSESRKAVFDKMTTEVESLLKEVGMPNSSIQIEWKAIDPSTSGIDEINLLFSANKGIKPQQLKNVASGGEFSRLMFCIKYVLADKTALPTIVFDEIDTGISGEIALKMVSMMKTMAKNHQVISISHLPQIAAKGDAHYFVYKDNSSAKTQSKIKKLSQEERITEIAKMIGGEKPSTIAFENAKELLAFNK
jgi:DNA repair protein RecN (Recombination protein N)